MTPRESLRPGERYGNYMKVASAKVSVPSSRSLKRAVELTCL